MPTERNILSAIKWLVDGASEGDSLFFLCAPTPESMALIIVLNSAY